MARERMTRRPRNAAKKILAYIDALERRVSATDDNNLAKWSEELTADEKAHVGYSRSAGIDEELQDWADDIAEEEREIAEYSTGEELSKEERHQLASELTILSKGMAQRIAKNGGLSEEDRRFVAGKLLAASRRVSKV